MGPPTHYPLSLGRVFALGWSIFKFAWRTMWAAAAICLIPAYSLMVAVAALYSPLVNIWLAEADRSTRLGLPVPRTPPGFDVAVVALLAASMLLLVASLLATATIVHVAHLVYRGEPVSAGAAVRYTTGRLVSLIGAHLLYFVTVALLVIGTLSVAALLIVGGGFATFIGLVVVVGAFAAVLFLAARISLLTQAIVIDRTGAAESLARSWRLVSGSGWRVFGYLLLVAVLAFLLGLILGAIPIALLRLGDTSAMDVATSTIIGGIGAIIVAPLAPIVFTLLYYDLRWQRGESAPVPGGGETSGRPQLLPR